MSDEQIKGDSPEADVKDQIAPTSQGEADSAVTANSEQATTDSHEAIRDNLVKQLVQAPVDENKEAEPAEQETSEDAEDDEDDDESPEKSKDQSEPKADEGADLESHKDLGERTKKTITSLRQKAAFGDLITKTLVDAKIAPEEFSRWTNLAARLKKGDQTAVNELIATAKAFGYKEPTVAPKQEKTVDDIAEEIYNAEFKAEVDDLNISESLARKQARKLAEVKTPKVEPKQEQTPVDNGRTDPIRDHALKTIDTLERDYESKVKDFGKIKKNVVDRLVSEYGSADPIHWVEGYNKIVRDEIRKLQPKPAEQKQTIKPVAGTQVRPTAVAAPVKSSTDVRENVIKDLVSGKLFT